MMAKVKSEVELLIEKLHLKFSCLIQAAGPHCGNPTLVKPEQKHQEESMAALLL